MGARRGTSLLRRGYGAEVARIRRSATAVVPIVSSERFGNIRPLSTGRSTDLRTASGWPPAVAETSASPAAGNRHRELTTVGDAAGRCWRCPRPSRQATAACPDLEVCMPPSAPLPLAVIAHLDPAIADSLKQAVEADGTWRVITTRGERDALNA